MTYQELIQNLKHYSISELEKMRDTILQKIDMVYQSADIDPENARADLKDQLAAVLKEIILREIKGQGDIQPRDPDAPVVTRKPGRTGERMRMNFSRSKALWVIIIALVLYKIFK